MGYVTGTTPTDARVLALVMAFDIVKECLGESGKMRDSDNPPPRNPKPKMTVDEVKERAALTAEIAKQLYAAVK
jgi:hypothetical protein